jgi:hypothetical protein
MQLLKLPCPASLTHGPTFNTAARSEAKNDRQRSMHIYEVRPRKDHRGLDLISDVLPCFHQFISLATLAP